jgi:hypothetical protein
MKAMSKTRTTKVVNNNPRECPFIVVDDDDPFPLCSELREKPFF